MVAGLERGGYAGFVGSTETAGTACNLFDLARGDGFRVDSIEFAQLLKDYTANIPMQESNKKHEIIDTS